MAALTSFIYDLEKPVDLRKAAKSSLFKPDLGGENFLFARVESLNVILFKNGKLRVVHCDGTRESLEKALPAAIPKIQKLVEEVSKSCGMDLDASEIISKGKPEEEAFPVERGSLGSSVGVSVLQEIAVNAPEAVLGEYQRERLSTQAGDTIGRRLAGKARDRKTLSSAIADFLKREGLGIAEFSEGEKDVVARFIVRESAFSFGLPPVGKPLCGFIRGLIRGAFAAFFKSESVSVAETRCWGTGDVECEFIVRQLAV